MERLTSDAMNVPSPRTFSQTLARVDRRRSIGGPRAEVKRLEENSFSWALGLTSRGEVLYFGVHCVDYAPSRDTQRVLEGFRQNFTPTHNKLEGG